MPSVRRACLFTLGHITLSLCISLSIWRQAVIYACTRSAWQNLGNWPSSLCSGMILLLGWMAWERVCLIRMYHTFSGQCRVLTSIMMMMVSASVPSPYSHLFSVELSLLSLPSETKTIGVGERVCQRVMCKCSAFSWQAVIIIHSYSYSIQIRKCCSFVLLARDRLTWQYCLYFIAGSWNTECFKVPTGAQQVADPANDMVGYTRRANRQHVVLGLCVRPLGFEIM